MEIIKSFLPNLTKNSKIEKRLYAELNIEEEEMIKEITSDRKVVLAKEDYIKFNKLTNLSSNVYILDLDGDYIFTFPGLDKEGKNKIFNNKQIETSDLIRFNNNLRTLKLNYLEEKDGRHYFKFARPFLFDVFCSRSAFKSIPIQRHRISIYFHELGHWMENNSKWYNLELRVEKLIEKINEFRKLYFPLGLGAGVANEFLGGNFLIRTLVALILILPFLLSVTISLMKRNNELKSDSLLKKVGYESDFIEALSKFENYDMKNKNYLKEKKLKIVSEYLNIFFKSFGLLNFRKKKEVVETHPRIETRINQLVKEEFIEFYNNYEIEVIEEGLDLNTLASPFITFLKTEIFHPVDFYLAKHSHIINII